MVLDAVANFVRGATDASVDSTQTTVSVVDASIFPDPSTAGEFNVVIWDAENHPRPDQDADVEIMRVTGRNTTDDDLTVTRGQETTSGASHPSGAAIHLSPTAKMFGDIESTFNAFWDSANSELTADVNNSLVSTDELVIGGKLYESDGTIDVSNTTSTTYSVSGTYDELIIMGTSGESGLGFDQLQVNGDTGSNYDTVDNADNLTTGQTEWSISRVYRREYLHVMDLNGDRLTFNAPLAGASTGNGIAGENANVSGPISQITLSDAGGSSRSLKARVFGRQN